MWASNRAPRGCSPQDSVPLVPDTRELVAERLALGASDPVGEVPIEQSREHPGCDHPGGEARAFLVGPVDDLDRRFRLDPGVVESAHGLQRGQHPEDPVELAAVGLGVEMAAGGHRGETGIPSRAPREHVAHLVHGDRAAGLLTPGSEEIAPAPVVVGQREPAAASAGQGADLRHLHDARPQARTVNAQIAGRGRHSSLLPSPVQTRGHYRFGLTPHTRIWQAAPVALERRVSGPRGIHPPASFRAA